MVPSLTFIMFLGYRLLYAMTTVVHPITGVWRDRLRCGPEAQGLHVRSPKKTMYSRADSESTLLERRRVIRMRRIWPTRQSRIERVQKRPRSPERGLDFTDNWKLAPRSFAQKTRSG
jgi:hypothetical protein